MRRIACIVVLLPLRVCVLQAFTLPPIPPDSLSRTEPAGAHSAQRDYTVEEVVVTATRTSVDRLNAPSRINIITPEQLQYSPEKNLGEQLVGTTGLLVRAYGPGGALQTVSFRGMGAEQSTVLVDGIPVNNAQTGVSDLSLVPLEGVTGVEVLRGGSSSLYGSNALGGVINVLTGTLPETFVRFESSARSFGSQRFGIAVQPLSSAELGLLAGGSVEYGRGDFAFGIQDGTQYVRAVRGGSDFRTEKCFGQVKWLPSPLTRASLLVTWLATERGTPGPVLTVTNQGTARQRDEVLFGAASLNSTVNDQLDVSFSASVHNAYLQYVDHGTVPADNEYRNISGVAQTSARFAFSRDIVVAGGVEVSHAVAKGNTLPSEKTRTRHAEFLSAEMHLDLSPFTVLLYPSLRYDRHAGVADRLSPKLGCTVRYPFSVEGKNAFVVAHSTIGSNFRIPTFNELYYAGAGGIGNLGLVPERSASFDAGATFGFPLAGWCEVDVTYFDIATTDRIQWLPTSTPTIWSPVNVGKTRMYGVELEGKWSVNETFTLSGNYSATNARKKTGTLSGDPSVDKQLLYVPLETGFVQGAMTVPLLDMLRSTLRLGGVFVGIRFTAEDNSVALPAYWIVNADWSNEWSVAGMKLRVKYEVANVFDVAYEVLPRYPMPLRTHSLSLSLSKHF